MKSVKKCLDHLKEKGFKLTPQRQAVIEYLEGNSSHPSAADMFREIKKKYPMISFATVYNTLRMLGEAKEIRSLTIGFDKVNFDPNTEPHNHFYCTKCGKIIDIFPKKNMKIEEIEGHQIKDHQIYYYGICSECIKANNSENQKKEDI
ncbi:MAG: Fur family transcriptional regulator [Acidobacteriota bacterium]